MSYSGPEESVSIFIEDETTIIFNNDDDDNEQPTTPAVEVMRASHAHSEQNDNPDMEQPRVAAVTASAEASTASSSSAVPFLCPVRGSHKNQTRAAAILISMAALIFLACTGGIMAAVILRSQDSDSDDYKVMTTTTPSQAPLAPPSSMTPTTTSPAPTTRPSQSPSVVYRPPVEVTTLLNRLLPSYTLEVLPRDENGHVMVVLEDDNIDPSPQAKALDWLRRDIEFQQTLPADSSLSLSSISSASASSSVDYPYSNDRLLQRYAMACFYFSTTTTTNSDTNLQPPLSWKNDTHWLSHTHHECQWHSASFEHWSLGPPPCLHNDRVVRNIRLPHNDLFGAVPKELALLTALEHLELNENQHLGGELLPEWATLTQLQVVYFGHTQVTGQLSVLTALTHARDVQFQNTQLTGAIPTTMDQLSQLEVLNLANIPTLTGPIPEELGYLPQLQVLILDDNSLTGGIPPTLRFLPSLRKLILSHNPYINGTLDDALFGGAAWKDSLQELWLSNTSLSGPIPTTLGDMTQLRQLFLYHNDFTSTIPTQLASLTRIERIHLRDNQLTGGIPTEFGSLPQQSNFAFRHLDVSGNDLSGTWDSTTNTTVVLPSELTRLPRLQDIYIFDNSPFADLVDPNISDALCDRVSTEYFHIYTDCHVTPCYCCYCREWRNETGQYVFYPPNDFLYG